MPAAMAQGSAMLVTAILAALLRVSAAAEFKVGGAAGWGLPSFTSINYTEWATSNKYHLGDTLVFDYYNQAHNVMIVDKVDFLACSSVNPIATFQDGHTVIGLNKTGPHYFICGVPGHCAQGQKLLVTARGRGKHNAAATAAAAAAPAPSASLKSPLHSGSATASVVTTAIAAAAAAAAALV